MCETWLSVKTWLNVDVVAHWLSVKTWLIVDVMAHWVMICTYEFGCGSWMWFAHMSVDVVVMLDRAFMTHSYVKWPIHMWHDPLIRDTTHTYVTWPLYMIWHLWLIRMWHDPFKYDMTHSYVTRLIHMLYDPFTWRLTCHSATLVLWGIGVCVCVRVCAGVWVCVCVCVCVWGIGESWRW